MQMKTRLSTMMVVYIAMDVIFREGGGGLAHRASLSPRWTGKCLMHREMPDQAVRCARRGSRATEKLAERGEYKRAMG